MLEIDLHRTSIFLFAGFILKGADKSGRATGMKGLAIATDHGLTMGGRLNDVF